LISRSLLVVLWVVLVQPDCGVVEYLAHAELQCENEGDVADALLYLIGADEAEIRIHMFPDYSGEPVWSLEEFLCRYFVPGDQEAAHLSEDPCAEVTTPRARRILKGFYAQLAGGLAAE
jgi:hypothetical protein